jgi:hypothetical protein
MVLLEKSDCVTIRFASKFLPLRKGSREDPQNPHTYLLSLQTLSFEELLPEKIYLGHQRVWNMLKTISKTKMN